MRRKRRELQMIFQDLDAALNPKMTVGELLREAITLQKPMPQEDAPPVRRASLPRQTQVGKAFGLSPGSLGR
jgi:ABC-type glutathione transport system ATPase component